ncbi:hypothetical protein ASF32_19360 [Methylobacterium sp. Leaf91]|nr:hypothetical protein ASF24_06685 [Methylobacterium sp. Leaf86]KQO94302.1 hypothetical protein ASF32_19360 [Methylobacterium sp. Leaf91]
MSTRIVGDHDLPIASSRLPNGRRFLTGGTPACFRSARHPRMTRIISASVSAETPLGRRAGLAFSDQSTRVQERKRCRKCRLHPRSARVRRAGGSTSRTISSTLPNAPEVSGRSRRFHWPVRCSTRPFTHSSARLVGGRTRSSSKAQAGEDIASDRASRRISIAIGPERVRDGAGEVADVDPFCGLLGLGA